MPACCNHKRSQLFQAWLYDWALHSSLASERALLLHGRDARRLLLAPLCAGGQPLHTLHLPHPVSGISCSRAMRHTAVGHQRMVCCGPALLPVGLTPQLPMRSEGHPRTWTAPAQAAGVAMTLTALHSCHHTYVCCLLLQALPRHHCAPADGGAAGRAGWRGGAHPAPRVSTHQQ